MGQSQERPGAAVWAKQECSGRRGAQCVMAWVPGACSRVVPQLLQHSHRWNGGAAEINSIHIAKFVAREMGSCDVPRKEFQGHTCENSLSVWPDLLG